MPCKGHTQKRGVLADPICDNKIATKSTNDIILDSRKGVAQKIAYGVFDRVIKTTGRDAMEVFEEAMNSITSILEAKAKRIGGTTYQVPIEVRPERRQALALHRITLYSRRKGEETQRGRSASKTMDTANNIGAPVRKKEDIHKMAEAGKAFSHFHF